MESGGGDVKLLPFHRFTIRSPLPPTEALDALRERLEPRKFFRWRVGSGP